MRPYLAILKDSFRATFKSPVLWIWLALITVFLLALAPSGYRQRLTGDLQWIEVDSWPDFVKLLHKQAKQDQPSPGKHLWPQLTNDLRGKLEQWNDNPDPNNQAEDFFYLSQRLAVEINDLLSHGDFYDKPSWDDVLFTEEATELLGRKAGDLSEHELQRRNRLLLEAAYPNFIGRSPRHSIQLTYLWADTAAVPFAKSEIDNSIEILLSNLSYGLVTGLFVMAGILVTCNIVPQTFNEGSINLLLSKPIVRSLLLLSKFAGGCTFMLLTTAYLVFGVWLILGLRFDMWRSKLLLLILVYTFAFAVYYSVSVLVGVVRRSAVLAVLVVILFWATCFSVGYVKTAMDEGIALFGFQLVQSPIKASRIERVVPAGDFMVGINEGGETLLWNKEEKSWDPIFKSGDSILPDIIGPVYVPADKALISAGVDSGGFAFGGRAKRLFVGGPVNAWSREQGVQAPGEIVALTVDPDGRLVVVSRAGIFRLVGDPLATEGMDTAEDEDGEDVDQEDGDEIGGEDAVDESKFVEIGPATPVEIFARPAVALGGPQGQLAIYSEGTLTLLSPDEQGRFSNTREKEIDGENSSTAMGAMVAIGDGVILLALHDGRVQVIEAEELEIRETLQPEGETPPRAIVSSGNGEFVAVLYQNRHLYLYDVAQKKLSEASLWSQGEISGVAMTGPSRMLVADDVARVRELRLPELSVEGSYVPQYPVPALGNFYSVYRWLIVPMYNVLPKPGELDRTVDYLLTGRKATVVLDGGQGLIQGKYVVRDPWAPVWSNLVFIVVILALACWYVERSEF